MKQTIIAITLAAMVSLPTLSANAEISMGQKIQLQSDMQRHIDAVSVDGQYLHYDIESGKLQTLFPAAGHPMILRHNAENMYVLCSEMRDASGTSHNVDYYMAEVNGQYTVIKTVIGNRAPLKALMEQGLVSKL